MNLEEYTIKKQDNEKDYRFEKDKPPLEFFIAVCATFTFLFLFLASDTFRNYIFDFIMYLKKTFN